MRDLSYLLAAGTIAVSAFAATVSAAGAAEHHLTGTIVSARGNVMLLRTRTGKQVIVDLTEARSNERVGIIAPHLRLIVYGTVLSDGTFHCTHTGHAAASTQSWEADR